MAALTFRVSVEPFDNGARPLARVNGRTTFWASKAPIPGGISFENFELQSPFAEVQLFRFGVAPELPSSLGFEWKR